MGTFQSQEHLPGELMDAITSVRVGEPGFVERLATERARRAHLTRREPGPGRPPLRGQGRLCLLALDHTARGVTGIGDNPGAMSDRHDLLARAYRVLQAPTMDGVMASMDLLQDLLILDHLVQDRGEPGILDGRVLVGSMNRGGISGSTWELDDPLTGPTADDLTSWKLDGGKLLLRLNPEDAGSLRTLEMCASALRHLSREGVPCFLEPLPVRRGDKGSWEVVLEADPLARVVGIATGLGASTHNLWLKLPWCPDFGRVAQATTLPILLLGGPSAGTVSGFLDALERGLGSAGNLRGAMVGRNVLYPGEEDPLGAAVAVGGMIHHGWSANEAQNEAARG